MMNGLNGDLTEPHSRDLNPEKRWQGNELLRGNPKFQLFPKTEPRSPTEEQYQWMVDGLKRVNALKDQEVTDRREHLNIEISRLNNRLSQLYKDKLDGVIDAAFYQKKAKEGRERLADLQEQLERVQTAGENQMALGLQILEFAKDAYPLFSRMIPSEQAKLLKIVFSKCCLKDGKLAPTYRKPFDVLAEGTKNEGNYPLLNEFRNALLEVPSGFEFEFRAAMQLSAHAVGR